MVKSCMIAKWSVIQMPIEYQTKFSPAFRSPFEYPTSIGMVGWIPNYNLNTEQAKVCYSDVSITHYSDVCCSDSHCIKNYFLPLPFPPRNRVKRSNSDRQSCIFYIYSGDKKRTLENRMLLRSAFGWFSNGLSVLKSSVFKWF